MKTEVGVVETGLEELSLKWICIQSVTTKKSSDFLDRKTNPPQDNPGSATDTFVQALETGVVTVADRIGTTIQLSVCSNWDYNQQAYQPITRRQLHFKLENSNFKTSIKHFQLESLQLRKHCISKATPTSCQSIWHIISISCVFFVRKYCVLGSSAWQPQMQITWRHAPSQH